MNTRNNWTREEHIIAFNVYSSIPFGQIGEGTPEVQRLAKLVGRTVGSASRKLANFARLDPSLQQRGIKGLSHGAKGEEEVWKEFANDPEQLALESEKLMAARLGKPIEVTSEIETDDLPIAGVEREALVRLRVKQSFFRRRVLSAYRFQCCVTGLTNQQLLVASHIIPWADDPGNRLNPKNGLSLNPLHDKAFDRRLMWIDDDFLVRLSPKLCESNIISKHTTDWLMSFEGKSLLLPENFQPDPILIAKHASCCVR
ncbi:MAG TPA: HNH endonuclease [Verrucomicrobiae bacterium]|jgi:putative restriction endonuclease